MRGKPKALVLTGFGINCEQEHYFALKLAGADADIVHLSFLWEGKVSIHDYDMLHLPGGFSYADDIAAGKALAGLIKHRKCRHGKTLFEELLHFIHAGKYVLGICNGFQALVSLGLLPGLSYTGEAEVALVHNRQGHFIDRWCHCYIPKIQASVLLPSNTLLDLPIRHAEGRLYVPSKSTKNAILDLGLLCMQYTDKQGNILEEIDTPNGSWMACAGLTNPTGQIVGLMPHPEGYLFAENHPDWAIRKRISNNAELPEGLGLFMHMVAHLRKTFKNNLPALVSHEY